MAAASVSGGETHEVRAMNDKQPTSPADVGMCGEDGAVGRDMAIPALGKAPWGTHFCQFFGTRQDLLDTLVPYFRAGLMSDEMCVWVTSDPLGVDEAAEALSRTVSDLEWRVAQGQILIRPFETWYGDPQDIDPDRYLKLWTTSITKALTQGYAGLRASGNLSWLEARRWKPFMAYESSLGQKLATRQAVVLCTYPLDMCDSSKMIDVLMRHQFALIKHGDWTLIEPSEQKKATAAVERMNQALAERTAQLQTALAELRGFTRWATDDLRAPLRSITSFGTWLAESCESKLDDDERHMLARVRANADRMGVLIADIQAYSTAQQKPLHCQPLDLRVLARNAWATLAGAVDGRRIDLRIRPLPRAYGDRKLLAQALTNLLGNAAKFTAGSPDPNVEVGALTLNGECVYYVRDNGIGFDPAYADKVFDPFERLHGKADFAGSGLGLTTVRLIIARHGGRVWAEATPGVGATFCFALPEPGHVARA
jgi:signal transduction histidine kinase